MADGVDQNHLILVAVLELSMGAPLEKNKIKTEIIVKNLQ